MEKNQEILPEELEAIENYLHDKMRQEERTEFEARLSGDISLQEKMAELHLLFLGVNEAVLKEKMKVFHHDLFKEKKHITGRTFSIKKWLAAASVLIVIAFSGWWLIGRQNAEKKLFANYFKPDPGLITAMSSTDNYAFEKAMIDYKKGDYTVAINTWDSLQKLQPGNDTLNYFLGVAQLANSNASAAIPYLEKTTAMPSGFFRADAFWYKGLALLKEGNTTEAIKSLEQAVHPDKDRLLQAVKNR